MFTFGKLTHQWKHYQNEGVHVAHNLTVNGVNEVVIDTIGNIVENGGNAQELRVNFIKTLFCPWVGEHVKFLDKPESLYMTRRTMMKIVWGFTPYQQYFSYVTASAHKCFLYYFYQYLTSPLS